MSDKKEGEKERERSGRVVPPGFRFHPTDEELIDFYLRKKVATSKFELDHVIPEVDLNKLEPWDLREKCKVDASHQTEWYFFSHKDKKYPTGTRTNRATKAGFWKATGRDKSVLSSLSQPHQLAGQRIGMRKTLVFYKGRAPHGLKTDWIMHEYRLQDANPNIHASKLTNEDGWVVCRVFKKKNYEDKSSTSASSYYDNTNLSDEEQAPIKSTHTTTTFPEVGSSQSIMSFSKSAQKFCKKQVQDMNRLASSFKTVVGNNLALFPCKQEVMGDQYEGLSINSYQPTTTTFFQLPHLESTEIISPNYHTINNIVNNPSIHTTPPLVNGNEKRVDGSQKVQHLSQYVHKFEEGTITPQAGKAYFMSEEDLAHCIDSNTNSSNGQHLAENIHCWSLYENFARLQGSEALANLANDQLFPHCNGVHLSKVQAPIDNYPSTYEIELWNFPR